MNANNTQPHKRSAQSLDSRSNRLLAIFAAVLAAILALTLSKPTLTPRALAGDVAQVGDLTTITVDAGGSEDIIATLDRRSEQLFIYGATRNELTLMQAYDLKTVFTRARANARR